MKPIIRQIAIYRVVSGICLLLLLISASCTLQDPVSIKNRKGNITGRVLPARILATISATQGVKTVATTTTDSAGYYYLANLTHGVYSLIVSANSFGTHLESNIIVYEGGTTAVRDLVLNPFPEQIYDCDPKNNQQEYALDAPITIYFNQPMDQASVESAFHTSPILAGRFFWNFTGNSVTFRPEPQFMASQKYEVILANSARTREGQKLAFPFTVTFYTTAVQVIQTAPLNGSLGVSTGTNLMFTFNSVMDKVQLPDHWSIKPETPGDFKWLDNYSMLFIPGTLLEPQTDYQIRLDSLVADIYGRKTGKPFIFYFSTEPTRILYTNPSNGAGSISRNASILVAFNAEMDELAVQNAFQITPVTAGQFRWDNLSTLRFVPSSPLLPVTLFTIRLGTGARTRSAHTLSDVYEFKFTTAP